MRRAVRALLVTPQLELLLMRFHFPWLPGEMWTTPGGALKRGETPEQALARELREETGLATIAGAAELWRREHVFEYLERGSARRSSRDGALRARRHAPGTGK